MAEVTHIIQPEFIRTLDEILDEHEECLKENWEVLPRDVQILRLERVAEARRQLVRMSGHVLEQVGEAPEKEGEDG